jgi:hypothetical protein
MYPTGIDLQTYLQRIGVSGDYHTEFLTDVMLSASARWESDTGWHPFLAEEQVRLYDGAGKHVLILDCGLFEATSVKIGGEAQTEGTDYWLQAKTSSGSALLVEFAYRVPPIKRTIEIDGKFGWSEDLPEDVRLALLAFGAAYIMAMPSQGSAGATEITQGPVKFKVGENSSVRSVQLSLYETSVARYRRLA